jgi:hypothetical protein
MCDTGASSRFACPGHVLGVQLPPFLSSALRAVGCQWRSWLRDCATGRKAAGSIPDPSDRNMAVASPQPLKETSSRSISWEGKDGRCVGLTNLLPSYADCLEIW